MWVNKWISAVLEMLGRFIFNAYPPEVGGMVRDIRYKGESPKQVLDIAIPKGEGPFPVMVYIHGGGFHTMGRRSYTRVAKTFASEGYLVFNVDYRSAPAHRFREQFGDLGEALRYAHEHAADFGGDNTRMFIGGDSAGATFSGIYGAAACVEEIRDALNIGPTIPPEHLRGLLLFYGTFDFDTVLDTHFPLVRFLTSDFIGKEPRDKELVVKYGSAIRNLTPDYPPAFITSGGRDHLHTESVAFSNELARLGLVHEECFFPRDKYPEAFHGFINMFFFRCTAEAMNRTFEFMRANDSSPAVKADA